MVSGAWYETSDQWLRFDHDGEDAFIHSSLVSLAPPNADLADAEQAHAWVALYNRTEEGQRHATASVILDLRVSANRLHVYVSGVDCRNEGRIFENVSTPLECDRPGEVWYLENIDRIHLIIEREAEDGTEIELRCGRHNDSSDQQLIFACLFEEDERANFRVVRPAEHTPTPGAIPSISEDCGDFEYLGTESQRFQIFEDWLTCEHGLDDEGYHALPDNESRAAIWWDFVELACGSDTSLAYWVIDFDDDWRCQQKAWPATDQTTATPSQTQNCADFEYRGTENQRVLIFEEWVDCEYGLDEYFAITDEGRKMAIWWEFVELACGTDTATHFYYIDVDDNWRCQLESWPDTEEPTPTPSRTGVCDDFEYRGTVNQRSKIFEEWLACAHDIASIDEFTAIADQEREEAIWWEFVALACGPDTADYYYDLDPREDWRCFQRSWSDGAVITQTPAADCADFVYSGTRIQRGLILDEWLLCEHSLDGMAGLIAIEDEGRREAIWWEFVALACGVDTATHYYVIDFDDEWRCKRKAWSDSESPALTPTGPQSSSCELEALSGSLMNRIASFERWLKCEHDIDYDAFWDLPDDHWAEIWWPYVEALCGADTATYYWDLDSDTWQCEQVPWDDHSPCGPVELTGTRINRILIFEQWLSCEYEMDYVTFLDTLNEDRQDEIWWEFIRIACGPDTEDYVWYLDEDWQCYQVELGQEDGHSA